MIISKVIEVEYAYTGHKESLADTINAVITKESYYCRCVGIEPVAPTDNSILHSRWLLFFSEKEHTG